MTILESLKSLSGYPLPESTLEGIAVKRGLELTNEADAAMLESASYRLAKADVFSWLSSAPDISQGGISISISDASREAFRIQAHAIFSELKDGTYKPKFGYKGDRL